MSEVPQVKWGICLASHAPTPWTLEWLLSFLLWCSLLPIITRSPLKRKDCVFLAVVVYQTLPKLLIIAITLIPDVSSGPLAVCLQVVKRKDVIPPVRQMLWVLLFQPVLTLSL